MSSAAKAGLVVLGLVALVGLWVGGTYNGLVSSQENVKSMFATIQAQEQRRMDLIPNVMETVKGSARFEQSTLQQVVAARSAWATAKSQNDVNGQVQAAGQFDSGLSRLLVTVEAYPDLKSTAAFRDLITTLEGSENRIAVARRDYNDGVQGYNVGLRRFPGNVVANAFGFHEWQFFQEQAGANQAPKVNFGS